MILLDTNALPVRGELRNPIMSALIKAAEANGVPICIPSLVIDESVNMRTTAASEASKKLREALSAAEKLFEVPPVYLPAPDEVGAAWRAELEQAFQVIPIDGSDAVEALRREAHRIPPARDGAGGRDAAIWLTAMRGRELHGDAQPVYLITNNTKDFSKDGGLHPALADEAQTHGLDVVYCKTLDDALSLLSTTFTYDPSDSDLVRLKELLPDILNEYSFSGVDPILSYDLVTEVTEAQNVQVRRALTAGDSWFTLLNVDVTMSATEEESGLDYSATRRVRIWAELGSRSGPIETASVERIRTLD